MNKKKTPTTRDVLIAAKELINEPKKWTKGSRAADDNGTPVDINNDSARSFCIVGAVYYKAITLGASEHVGRSAFDLLEKALPASARTKQLHVFNDRKSTTHGMIIRLFDRAIGARAR